MFHYDEIGLFQPAIVMPNGYRYYEVRQMELLDTILLLKELGMPLKEIRDLKAIMKLPISNMAKTWNVVFMSDMIMQLFYWKTVRKNFLTRHFRKVNI